MKPTHYKIDIFLPDVEIHLDAKSLTDAEIWWGDYVANTWERVGTYAECLAHFSFLIYCAENNYETGYGNTPFTEVFEKFVSNCQQYTHKKAETK